MKSLHCRDAGFDCDGIIREQTEEEVLNKAAKHALEVHGVSVTPDLTQQLRTLIKDEKQE